MWHLMVPVKSHKEQLEAMNISKQDDFARDFECQKCSRILCSLLEQRIRTRSQSSDFERPVAAEHGRAEISSAKQALCGVFKTAHWIGLILVSNWSVLFVQYPKLSLHVLSCIHRAVLGPVEFWVHSTTLNVRIPCVRTSLWQWSQPAAHSK